MRCDLFVISRILVLVQLPLWLEQTRLWSNGARVYVGIGGYWGLGKVREN